MNPHLASTTSGRGPKPMPMLRPYMVLHSTCNDCGAVVLSSTS